ncbi:MAG: hypothetical protein AAFS10_05845 [Myxococcota bacterium]
MHSPTPCVRTCLPWAICAASLLASSCGGNSSNVPPPQETPPDTGMADVAADSAVTDNTDTEATNRPPSVTILSPDEGAVFARSTGFAIDVQARDDRDPPDSWEVALASNIDGPLAATPFRPDGMATQQASGLSPGQHTITVTVTDREGLHGLASLIILIDDAPTVAFVQPEQQQQQRLVVPGGATAVLHLQVFDDHVDPRRLGVMLESDRDGPLAVLLEGPDSMGAAVAHLTRLSEGVHTVTARATDMFGQFGVDTMTLQVMDEYAAFVSNASYQGDLGGLTHADALCNDEAKTAGLVGNYRALLSTQVHHARTRLSGEPTYVLVDGTELAHDLEDLFDHTIRTPLHLRAGGGAVSPEVTAVWTASSGDGLRSSDLACEDWTSNSTQHHTTTGDTQAADDAWLTASSSPCNAQAHLYCFQVGPDKDADGLTHDEEIALGCSDDIADSDGDGVSDGEEYWDRNTDPSRGP